MNELFVEIMKEKPEIVKFYSPELVEFYSLFGEDGLEYAQKDAENIILDFPNQDIEFYQNMVNSTMYFDIDETNANDLEIYQDVVYLFLSDDISKIVRKSIRDFRSDQDDYPHPEYTRTIIK